MIRKDFNRQNAFFATYHIYDTHKGHYTGIIEHHDHQVKKPYFVAWKFENNHFIPNTHQAGTTATFDTYTAALLFIYDTISPADIHAVAAALLPPDQLDHHTSDLYIKASPEADQIIKCLQPKSLLSSFISQMDNCKWYDLPFCYDPTIKED